MRLFIEPTETLLFRKGRSFEAGDGNFAESMFPPTPETIQGALRAAIAAQSNPNGTLAEAFERRNGNEENDLVRLIGNREYYGRFRITGFTLGQRKKNGKITRLFPSPANLLRDGKALIQLLPQKETGVVSNLPDDINQGEIRYLLPPKNSDIKNKLKPLEGWITESGLQKLLRHRTLPKEDEIISNHQIYEFESRVGIGMENSTKTTKEGLLYSAQMVRMKPDFGFVVDIHLSKDAGSAKNSEREIELIDDTKSLAALESYLHKSWLTLGGERRTAYVEVLEDSQQPKESPLLEQDRKGNMLYLATPTYFSQGWLPDHWPQNATLVSAALNHYQPIGGWKLEPGHYGGASKDMRRCVPAGSIYFFKETIDFPQPLIQNVSNAQDNYGWQIGYGISYAGEYKS